MESAEGIVVNSNDCVVLTDEEVLCDPQCSVPEKSIEAKLESLLNDWNLQKISKDLEESGVTYENIKYLEQAEIERIFPGRKNIGLQAEFRHKLFSWKLKNFSNDPEVLPSFNCSCNAKVIDWLPKVSSNDALLRPSQSNTPSLVDSVNSIFSTHVRDILKSTNVGQGLLKQYAEHNILEKEQRQSIVNCIVEFCFDYTKNTYIIPKPLLLDIIADEIVEIFPTENKDTYFISRKDRKRQNPCGLLVNRFNNINRKKRKIGCKQSLELSCTRNTERNVLPNEKNVSFKNKMQ